MTGQRPHSVFFRNRSFTLSSWRGKGLFNPRDHGLELEALDTACVSGFVADYVIWHDQLILAEVRALLPLSGIGVGFSKGMMLGDSAEREECPLGEEWRPDEFRLPFSGAMLIGHEFIPEFYRHWGFQGAFAHEEVFELGFEEGHLISRFDRSREMAEIRREIEDGVKDKDYEVETWLSNQANAIEST